MRLAAVVLAGALGSAACLSTVKEGSSTTTGPKGATVTVPAGAIAKATDIHVDQVTSGYPALPAGTSASEVFAFTPHGQTFSSPVTIRIPAGGAQTLMTASPGGTWSKLDATVEGNFLVAQVSHFSFFAGVNVQPQMDGGAGDGCDHCVDPSCTVLISGRSVPHALTSDATSLYWAEYGNDAGIDITLWRMAKSGGAAVRLADIPSDAVSLTVDGANLYWLQWGTPGFFTVPVTGGAVVQLASDLNAYPDRLFLAGPSAYEQSHAPGVYGGNFTRIELDGGAETTLISQTAYYAVEAIDSSFIYYLTGSNDLLAIPVDGGAPVPVLTGIVPGGVVTDSDNLYLVQGGIESSITRIARDGGAQTVLATGLNQPFDLTLDGAAAYMATGEGVTRVDLVVGGVSILVPDPPDGGGGIGGGADLTIDSASVYWSNMRCGTVSTRSKN
jgi:hypothetical protein